MSKKVASRYMINVIILEVFINKDNNFVIHGTLPKQSRTLNPTAPLATIPTDELFEYCIAKRIGYGYYCEEKRRRVHVDPTIDVNTSYGEIVEWLDKETLPTDLYSTVIVGQTGIGKTSWAVKYAPKPAIIVSHIEDLKAYQPNIHKSIIFDDISFRERHLQAQIHLVDSDLPRSIHVRWGTVQLPPKVIKIFTCNEFPFEQHPAILRRIKFIKD